MSIIANVKSCINKKMLLIHRTYLQIYLLNLVLNFCLFYLANFPAYIKKGIGLLLMVCGLALSAYNILNTVCAKKYTLSSFLLFGLVCCIGMSGLINYKYGIIETIKICVWSFVLFFVVFPYCSKIDSKFKIKEVGTVTIPAMVVWGIMEFVAVVQFIFQITYFIDYPEYPLPKAQGVCDNRVFGIFVDAPMAATVSWSFLLLGIVIYFNWDGVYKKIAGLCVLLNWIYLVLANSRTGKVIAIVGAFIIIFTYLLKWSNKKWNIGVAAIAIFFSCALVVGGIQITQSAMAGAEKITRHVIESIVEQKQDVVENYLEETNLKNNSVSFERVDLAGKPDFSNFRFQIWRDSIKAYLDHPIFGISIDGFYSYMSNAYPESIITKGGFDVGNGYLAVLIYAGPVAALFVVALIVIQLKRLVCFWQRNLLSDIKNMALLPIFALVFSIGVVAAINMDIFFINWVNAMIFWLSLGVIDACWLDGNENEESKQML